jgi:glycosyltransferase involved in cell wall biosynthesis
MDVSVIIATYRRPQQLRAALSSVLSQPGISLEVIVVDDCPQSSAQDVVGKLGDARIRYFENPTPSGGFPSRVRNVGWPLAQGELIHFFDDDDVVPDRHYFTVKQIFSRHSNVGVVFGHIEPFGNPPEEQMRHEQDFFRNAAQSAAFCRRLGRKRSFAARMMFRSTLLVCGAAVVRRECVVRLNGFDPQIKLAEDVEFFARAMRKFGAHFMDQVSLHYRIGAPSLMHAPKLSEQEQQHLRDGYRRMQAKYRETYGAVDFYAMKIFSRFL